MLVLEVQRRESEAERRRRFPLAVEEQLSLPGFGLIDLYAAVYHIGEPGRYTCACRSPDGCFWYFDRGAPL